MNHEQIFQGAKWISGDSAYFQQLIRGTFNSPKAKSAKITITGLGFFEFYINAQRATADKFVPAWTDYSPVQRYADGNKVPDEFRHRVYALQYDILPLLKEGENKIAVALGGGWHQKYEYGFSKLCYLIEIIDKKGNEHCIASLPENHRWHPSYIKESNIIRSEIHDYNIISKNWFYENFDDSSWQQTQLADAPKAEFFIQDCPADKIMRTITPELVHRNKHYSVYDVGENMTGSVIIKTSAPKGEEIEVVYSEELDNGKELSFNHNNSWGGRQFSTFISDGTENLTAKVEFTWMGFRYFSVSNNATPLLAEVIHCDLPVASAWSSDNETLNWLYNAFIDTQLANSHAGIPSDCPHREGRGYTGDGQLTSDAVMLLFDARSFYEKWLEDIYDCQDLKSGHVQYTAPYVTSGGGPGGWGGAVAIVPYVFYSHFGDIDMLKKFFPRIALYFKYLEAHSENDLVISDEPWAWCLGDWCTPDEIAIPEPFVNNYFYIKTLEIYINIAKIIGQEDKIPEAEKTIERKKQAIIDNYFNNANGDFCENIQGANAFAVDIGLGDERTFQNIVKTYSHTPMYDTGIFGTDIVTRVLFENGHAQLAFDLLTSKERVSYYSQMIQGATSLWEYWDGGKSRSHPMFGAVVKYLFYYLLGIHQKEGEVGFENIIISPKLVDGLNYCQGGVKNVYLRYVKTDRDISFTVNSDKPFTFEFKDKTFECEAGEHELTFLI